MEEKQVKKITLGSILGWGFGALFLFLGLASLLAGMIIEGLLILGMAIILLPPANKFIAERFKFKISTGLKIVLILVLLVATGEVTSRRAEKRREETNDTSITEVTEKTEKEVDDKAPTEKIEKKKEASQETRELVKQGEVKEPQRKKVSYTTAMTGLESYFNMKNSPLNDGRDRYMATHKATTSMLEIIGAKSDIDSATLIIFFPEGLTASEAEKFTDTTATITSRFVKNLFSEDYEEALTFIQRIVKEKGEDSKYIGEWKLEVIYATEMQGMTTIDVSKQ